MSFTTNKPDGATQPVTLQLARRPSAPAFRPQIARSVRLHPLLALGVGAVVLVAAVGYGLKSRLSPGPPGELPEARLNEVLLLSALPLAMLCGAFAAVLARKRDARIYGDIDIQDLIEFLPLAILPARGEVTDRVYEEHVLRLAGGIEGAYRSSGARTFLFTPVSLTTDAAPLTSALMRKLAEIGVDVVAVKAGEMLVSSEGTARVSRPQSVSELADSRSRGFAAANLARLKDEHGLVLIESEPLLHCAQTEYVARCADATILVVECGVTTRHSLLRAAELLERMHVTGIGAVLQEMQLRFADAGYREAIEALERRQAAAPVRPTARTAATEKVKETPVSAEVRRPEAEMSQPVNVGQPETVESRPVESETASKEVTAATEHVTVRRGFAGDVARGPMLVETHAESAPQHEEFGEEEPLIAMANGTLHEKMTPMLSGRREAQSAAGDSGMIRTKSWLDRLLRRDGSPSRIIPRIVPDGEDDDAAPANVTVKEDYDLPLATRLDQISRQRPVAPASATKASSRLQIVPPEEPFEIVVPARRPALDASAKMWQIEAPVFEPVHKVAAPDFAPAVARVEEPIAVLAEIPASEPVVAAAPAIEHAKPQGPPRPLSFQELTELAQQQEHVPVAAEAALPLPVEAPEAIVEPVLHAVSAEVAAPVEAAAAPVAEAQQEIEKQAHLAPPVSYEEAAPFVEHVVAETIYEPAPVSEEPVFAEASHEYPAQYEADDIEPVYEQASRHLTTGRWDPIPTLRPDENGWRDRPSPIPPANPDLNGERPRWTGVDDDQDAWASSAAYRTEPLPEPLLTRQWGLLSKFQQARISSGQHSIAKTEDDEQPVSKNGKR